MPYRLAKPVIARSCLAIALSLLSIGAFADIVFADGRVETEKRSVPAFDSVRLSGSGTLRVHRGPKRLELTSDSNILPYITTTVVDGELIIGIKPFTTIMSSTKMDFEVSLPDLSGIRLSGSGNAYVDAFAGDSFSGIVSGSGGIKADLSYAKVSLSSSGSGGFDAKVKADSLDLRCSGSGGAYLSGSAVSADIVLTGSGEMGARDLAVLNPRISISGSGSVEIKAEQTLAATISGSGRVKYWGNPKVSKKVSGSGRVARAGD